MANELERFNEAFPNSSYREIHKQVPENAERKEYQMAKSPLNSKVWSYDDIKDTDNRIGWIIPNEYVAVDIDDRDQARVVYDILTKEQVKFAFMTSRHGGHFIFKNTRNVGIGSHFNTSIGITIDTRSQSKGYIILPHNDPMRNWGNITNDVDELPSYLVPLKSLTSVHDFMKLEDGDGRNTVLFEHFMNLQDYAPELTIDEKKQGVELINKYIFKDPLDDEELFKTVLRDDLIKPPQQETTNTEERIATEILSNVNIITSNGTCYIWTGKFYRPILYEEELERIIHTNYSAKLKTNQRKEVIEYIKLKSYVDPSDLNREWNEITLRNGVLNIETLELTQHDPAKKNTIYIDVNYNENCQYSSLIDTFFNDISGNDPLQKTLLYEIVGYCMVRRNIFSKCFIIFGEGQTGKSTYLNLLTKFIGEDNCAYMSLSDLDDQYMPSELFGKLLNSGDDIPYKGIRDTSVFKKVVTGEAFYAAQKYKKPILLKNFAKLIFTANALPRLDDVSTGLHRRLCFIECNHRIDNPDPYFLDKLTDLDFEYLLMKGVTALRDAISRNKLTTMRYEEAIMSKFKTAQSSTLQFIEDKGYTRESFLHKSCSEVYALYRDYCLECGMKCYTRRTFENDLCREFKYAKKHTTYNGDQQTMRYENAYTL